MRLDPKGLPQLRTKIARHHPDEDPDYFQIFGFYDDFFTFKLVPTQYSIEIHKTGGAFDRNNDLMQARLMHYLN
ncbi:MAG: hypothetical protein V3V33_07230 [Candidatus Lokiarchaeia archaeon]